MSLEIELGPELGVAEAEALRNELIEALDRECDVQIKAAGVNRIGTAALQVLLAFRRELLTRERKLRFVAPSRALLDATRDTGLTRALGIEADAT